MSLPLVGRVDLPAPAHVGWYAGVAVLTALEVVEWPVALLLAAGKALADNRHNATLRDLGEALEDA